MLWNRIRRDLERGVSTLLSVGRYLAERTRVETSLAKVVFDNQKIQKKIDEKTLELGERLFEIREDKNALRDAIIRDLLSEIQTLKKDQELYQSRVKDLGGDVKGVEGDDEDPPASDPDSGAPAP